MKKHSQRAQRVGDQIQKEMADLLRHEVKDPRVGQITVTHVHALMRTSGFLRTQLSHRLDLYSVPQLHFAYDDSIEAGMKLSQLIDDAVAADKKLVRD